METISLKKRLLQQYMLVLGIVFLAFALTTLYVDASQAKDKAKLELEVSHQAVEQAFNTYLTRAEYEVNFIAQDISLRSQESMGTLERLFRNHDVLFLGGLDFFYISWQNGDFSVDPRSRLYTRSGLENLSQGARIDQWSSLTTSDNANLLVFKKKLVSDQKHNLGFLYGYVSLNDNLTLAGELINSSGVDGLRILKEPSDTQALLEAFSESQSFESLDFFSMSPLKIEADAGLYLEVGQSREKDLSNYSNVLLIILSGLVLVVLLYLVVAKYIEAKVLVPLSALRAGGRSQIPFTELKPLQQQHLVHQRVLEADKRRFQALLEMNQRAVIFCSEVAQVIIINKEAKRLFPGYQRAKTLFDFFPVQAHQEVRDVLKGIPQASFKLRIDGSDSLFEWQVRPFINESSYRGLMLVGQDITDKESLTWQLMQLSPESGYMQEKIESQSLLNEMAYLSSLTGEAVVDDLQGWIRLLLSIFDDLNEHSDETKNVLLGELISSEHSKILQELTTINQVLELDCSTETGLLEIPCGRSLEVLVRLFLMLSVTQGDGCKLRVSPLQQGLELSIHEADLSSRPLLDWVLNRLLDKLDGEQRKQNDRGVTICLPLTAKASPKVDLPGDFCVALIGQSNEYAPQLLELLQGLGVFVNCYQDAEQFFAQSKKTSRFDAVFAVSCQNEEVLTKLTRSIKDQYGSKSMPLIWLTCYNNAIQDPSVFSLQNGLSEFHVYQALVYASQQSPIIPLSFHYQGVAWILIGGSRVQKAVLQAHLTNYSIPSQSFDDLSDYEGILSYYMNATMVLLEEQDEDLLSEVQQRFPDLRLITLQESTLSNCAFVTAFKLQYPYSFEQVKRLVDQVNESITEN
ncbi:hypothetical protein [Marinomonas epiphytica]